MICTPCIYGIPCGFYTVCTAHDKQFDSLTAPRNCVILELTGELRAVEAQIKELEECLT